MPTFKTAESKEQIYLPSTAELEGDDRAWVVMDTSPLKAGDVEAYESGINRGAFELNLIMARLKDWNYTDANGVALPITLETVKLLDITDFKHLQSLIENKTRELSTDEKKSSSATSQPLETAEIQT